ncbi:MAG TPA: S1 RNA-binding domain-containing protein [Candidatus Portnoybacteria bacterium]|nr:S1 RNA-binding domain-containing protein [Candidatus Portnoybacteria bacterium]
MNKLTIKQINQEFPFISSGTPIQGKAIKSDKGSFFIDISPYGLGVIPYREARESHHLIKKIQPDTIISGIVINPENKNGYIEISLREARHEEFWDKIERIKKEKEIITVNIVSANKGGLIISYQGVEGFLPLSQLSIKNYPRFDDANKNKILNYLTQFVGQNINVIVIDVNKMEGKIVVSERAIYDNSFREILQFYQPGTVVEGVVSGIVDFGLFIRFAPSKEATDFLKKKKMPVPDLLEGLVHISEIDWQVIDNPHKQFKVGDKIKAAIWSIEHNRFCLSVKTLKDNPWSKIKDKVKEGNIIEGVIKKINSSGALVQTSLDVQGTVLTNNDEALNLELNNKYQFKITSLDCNNYKMVLELVKEES